MSKNEYAVVFEYTEAAGDYRGVRTYTTYESEEDFEKTQSSRTTTNGRTSIIAKGVTTEEAAELARQTPLSCRVRSCIAEATDAGGEFNIEIFCMHLRGIVLAHQMRDEVNVL